VGLTGPEAWKESEKGEKGERVKRDKDKKVTD
jgi:hypothetical protein